VLATTAVGAAGVVHQITTRPGRSGTKASIDRRSGRDAPGTSTASASPARLRQGSATAASPRIHLMTVPGVVRSARQKFTTIPAGIDAGGRAAVQTRASLAPGRIVSEWAGAGGRSRTHPVSGRPSAATHARGPGASGSQRSTRRSAGATHRASKPGRRAPAARPVGSPSPDGNGQPTRPATSVLPGSRTSSASRAPSLASSGVGNLASAAGSK